MPRGAREMCRRRASASSPAISIDVVRRQHVAMMLSVCADMWGVVRLLRMLLELLLNVLNERGKDGRQHAKTYSWFFASTLYHETANDAS
jgi:hypothetical protein